MCSCSSGAKEQADDYIVGIEYFAGWWEDTPNKWQRGGVDWREQYPDRIPINGEYNSQETMDKDILVASSNGVDFFSILWYPDKKRENSHVHQINRAVNWFKESKYSDKMEFMLEITNHAPFGIVTESDWDGVIELCVENFAHPSYLKIDGRSVLKIHGGGAFVSDLGGAERANQYLAKLRKEVADAGLGDVIIALGLTEDVMVNNTILKDIEFDFSMQYTDPTALPQREEDYPYELLAQHTHHNNTARATDSKPYLPYTPVNWNPRPWGDKRANFTFATADEWRNSLTTLKGYLDTTANFGFPRRDGTKQKGFTIYAWNEYGEGGFMAPSKGYGNMKLEVLNEVFPN